jgi:serine/threonine protein kinase
LEYVEGGELFDYLIKKGKLEEKEAVHYFRQIINGVNYCHQFNICHRDLKPENLLLDKNLNIKIADFGMAALEINQKLLETSCGSPHYASPEIVAGKVYHGSPSDVWSCGIILFALLTGHLPFDDENIRKLLMKVQSGRFVTPNFLSPDAKDLIWKMLKVNPNDRIKVFEILKHPLLKRYENNSNITSTQGDQMKLENYYHEADGLSLTKESIDRDLLTSLSILFHGIKESSLIPKLLEKNSNPEKIFYYLLLQYKEKHQIRSSDELMSKNSKKKKASNGDGLLKKSKSTIYTTVVEQDGSTTVTVDTVKEPPSQLPPLLMTPIKKKITRNQQSELQISASSTYRRGVSFNNKQISSSTQNLSRTSSKTKMGTAEVSKKRQSILPPLPDVDVDWLKVDPNGMNSNEFASLYDEIFNNYRPTPKSSPKNKKSRPVATAANVAPSSSPLRLAHSKPENDAFSTNGTEIKNKVETSNELPSSLASRSLVERSSRRFVSEPLMNNNRMLKSSTLKLSNLMDFKTYEPPVPTLTKKASTLDPKYRQRIISNNNAEVLTKVGLNLRNTKTRSRIFYSKSSTSMNLSSILKSTNTSSVMLDRCLGGKSDQSSDKETRKVSNPPEVPDRRAPSSNYSSYENESAFNSSNDEVSFDFEVPTQTELAQAIQVSNGSDLTVGKNVQAREDSMFEDLDTVGDQDNLFKVSNSTKSVIKYHKRAVSSETKVINQNVDIRGSLFNPCEPKDDAYGLGNPSDFSYQRPRHDQTEDIDEDIKSTMLNNSLYADNTDDENDFANAKRVTMIFDEYDESSNFDESPVRAHSSYKVSPTKPLKSSPLKSIQEKNFKRASDGTLLKDTSKVFTPLEPRRVAPSAPSAPKKESADAKSIGENVHKSNWFTRFFSNLISSSDDNVKKVSKKNKYVKVFTPKRAMDHTRKSIRNVLEIKRKEGTLTTLKETENKIYATIPPTFALGKTLRFEIVYDEDLNEIRLQKVKGSKKVFKNLANAMEYVIDNGSF